MFKIIIPILVIALAAFVGMNAKSGLIRGVADGMLVSPNCPLACSAQTARKTC